MRLPHLISWHLKISKIWLSLNLDTDWHNAHLLCTWNIGWSVCPCPGFYSCGNLNTFCRHISIFFNFWSLHYLKCSLQTSNFLFKRLNIFERHRYQSGACTPWSCNDQLTGSRSLDSEPEWRKTIKDSKSLRDISRDGSLQKQQR